MEFNNKVLFYFLLDFFLTFFHYSVISTRLLKFNTKPDILVRQLLNGVIFRLALNKPYLLLLGLVGSFFLFLFLNFPQPF